MATTELDYRLNGKMIETAHLSTGHGRVLTIRMGDHETLYVWAFDDPDRLQIVLFNEKDNKILMDQRTPDCIAYTEKILADYRQRFPHLCTSIDPPVFRTYTRGVG